jgi:hypothetical protein
VIVQTAVERVDRRQGLLNDEQFVRRKLGARQISWREKSFSSELEK